jgi:hypothetical protein
VITKPLLDLQATEAQRKENTSFFAICQRKKFQLFCAKIHRFSAESRRGVETLFKAKSLYLFISEIDTNYDCLYLGFYNIKQFFA